MTPDDPADAWINDYEAEEVSDTLARERLAAHGGLGAVGHHYVNGPAEAHRLGALGECAFAAAFGLDVDRTARPRGDGGRDFLVTLHRRIERPRVLAVDVKTAARVPPFLLVSAEHITKGGADFYVLAQERNGAISFVGWDTRAVMACMPVADFGSGHLSHFRPREQLRPMGQLVDLFAMRLVGEPK